MEKVFKNKINKKIIFWIFSFFWIAFWIFFLSRTFWNSIEFDTSIDSIYSGWSNSFSVAQFKYWQNNYEWLIFWKDFLNTSTWISIKTENLQSEVICHKQVRWYYFNSARWTMLRPLDEDSLSWLKTLNASYSNLYFTWWRFFDCDWVDENNIYWQIKQVLPWNMEYFLVAWVVMDYTTNNYNQIFSWSLQYTKFVWQIRDSFGWIADLTPWVVSDSPDSFTIKDITGAELNVYYKSDPIKISWLSMGKKVLAMVTKWVLYINWVDNWSMWNVWNDDLLSIKLRADKNYNTMVSSNLIIGTKYDTFSIITVQDDQTSLSTSEKLQILWLLAKLKDRYKADPPRQKLFIKEFLEKVKEQLSELQTEINNWNPTFIELNIKRSLILEFMSEKLTVMYASMQSVSDMYTSPNWKPYTIIFDQENNKCTYTAKEFTVKKCFSTYDKIIKYINSKNPVWSTFINKDVIVAPNGKTYIIIEIAKWLRTSPGFTTKRYFTSLQSLQNYISQNNKAVKERSHVVDTWFDAIYHKAPNGKEYEISKTLVWQYFSQNFQTPKYFSSTWDIIKYIDVNNKRR